MDFSYAFCSVELYGGSLVKRSAFGGGSMGMTFPGGGSRVKLFSYEESLFGQASTGRSTAQC
jgi:hypothetical protein